MANEAIDWSRYMEGLQGKANTDNTNLTGKADGVIDYQVNPDGSWYRQWKSGWLEQGGWIRNNVKNEWTTINFLKPFADTNYTANSTRQADSHNTWSTIYLGNKTTTSIQIACDDGIPAGAYWQACGMGGV